MRRNASRRSVTAAASSGLPSSANPEPAPVNLALTRPATSSLPCATTEGPEKAFNGSVSGGRSDKFCTKVADRWLEAPP